MVARRNNGARKRKTAVWIALFWVFALLAVAVAPVGSARRGGGGTPVPTVELGVDKTWSTANWGNSGTGMSGLGCTRYLGAGYDTVNRRALVNTWAILMGFCTLEAFADVGQSFFVTGSGSMVASVRMNGHYQGEVHALVAASSSVSLELHVKDYTAGTEWSTVIANPSCGAACVIDPNSDFDKSVVAKFDAGHWYLVYLHIYAKASLYAFFPVLGEAKVDFGPYDDDSGGGSWYNWFLVDF